jgi:Fe-S oxidoreductase
MIIISLLSASLIAAVSDFKPEAVVLWCPTCLYRIDQTISSVLNIPFQIQSFPQYLAANMNKLTFSESVAETVTLHEACKSIYTGLDLNGPRDVLIQLPGIKLNELENRGSCCGGGAIYWFPESGKKLRANRP